MKKLISLIIIILVAVALALLVAFKVFKVKDRPPLCPIEKPLC